MSIGIIERDNGGGRISVIINPGVRPPPHPTGTFALGVNLSGGENQFPQLPSIGEMEYFVGIGVDTFRVPLGWSQTNAQLNPSTGLVGIQQAVNGPLDTTSTYLGAGGYLGALDAVIAGAASFGATCLLDIHTFGIGPGGFNVGSAQVPVAAFADLWDKIAAHYASTPGIRGFDLMNEWPNGFDSSVVFAANQAAIIAVRNAGFTGPIYIEGTNFSGAWNWVSGQGQPFNNANLYQLSDPINNLIFSAHIYPDPDSSGSNFSWASCISTPGSAPPGINTNYNIFAERVGREFVPWLIRHGLRGHIGEYGSSNDSPTLGGAFDFSDWNITLRSALTYCRGNNLQFDLWGAGLGFPAGFAGYGYNSEPVSISNGFTQDYSSAGVQAPQTAVLKEFAGYQGPEPTSYLIFPPNWPNAQKYGSAGVTTGSFTLYYGGKISSPVTITPVALLMDGTSGGGAFAPASIVLNPGENALASFTYTPSQAATFQISATNNAGWTNPPYLGFTTLTDNFATATNPTNIYGMRRLYAPYIGPALELQRITDGATANFYFNNRGDLPRQAIQDWADGRTASIVVIYDQSPAANHLSNNTTWSHGYNGPPSLTLVNSDGYPQITCSGGNAMFTTTPSFQKGMISIITRMNSASTSGALMYQNLFSPQILFVETGCLVGAGDGSGLQEGVSLGTNLNTWANLTATWNNSYSTNNMNGYQNGSLFQAVSGSPFELLPNGGQREIDFHVFNFGNGNNFVGGWQEAIITYDELSPTVVAAFNSADVTYYTTALPDVLGPAPPTVVGVPAMVNDFIGTSAIPYGGVTVTDSNAGSPTETVTITLSGDPGATLTGTGLSGSNPYTIAADTPANITTKIRSILYTTTSPIGTIGTMALTVTSSAGASFNAATQVQVVAYTGETPFPAPVGTFTPMNLKGFNISGAELTYPATSGFNYYYPFVAELDYALSKGLGLIRMPVIMPRLYPNAFSPLDPAGRTDEPPCSYYTGLFPFGGQCNLETIQFILDNAFANNQYVIIDNHSPSGLVWDGRIQNYRVFGADPQGTALYVDYWSRVATKFKNYPNVIFGLCNEPSAATVSQTFNAHTAAITAIRATGATNIILISGGGGFDGAHDWTSSGNAAQWAGFSGDPANNFIFEMHQYLDFDSSGQHPTVVAGLGAIVLNQPGGLATSWLASNGFRGFLGEFGWNFSDSQPSGGVPSTEGAALMHSMTVAPAQWVGWSFWLGGMYLNGGYGFSSYVTSITPLGYPTGPFTDAPQMSIVVANI